MKERNIALCILFTIITFGIYGIYWFICLTNESNDVSKGGKTASGGVAFLLTIITFGIYGIYWAYKLGEKLEDSAVAYLVLQLFGLGLIVYVLAQAKLNHLVDDQNTPKLQSNY